MAAIDWTPSQKEAISANGGNILVSAAAGSGKTAVLAQRVLNKVLDPEDPKEIDSFVIITFTKKAASQMKEKIRNALAGRLEEDPGSEYIKCQLLKLPRARISTIDALCLDIVRENFHAVDMDPAFRIAAKEETEIIKKDVLTEIFEENYASKKRDGSKEAFINFIESYIGRDDSKAESLVRQIYAFSQSDAEPFAWLDESISVYTGADNLGADMEMPRIWSYFKEYVMRQLSFLLEMSQKGLEISKMPGGPYKYIPFLEKYEDMATRMLGELERGQVMFSRLKEELSGALPDKKLPVFTSKADRERVDPKLKEEGKVILSECKKLVKDELLAKFFSKSLEEHYADLSACGYAARTLISLTKEFALRFEAEKRKRAIADFSDISHGALKVLIEHDENGRIIYSQDGRPVYTASADLMAKNITEIIVDEYQDTNLLQEYIINALSSERFGRSNVFMVGDMKQSIYRFRFAVPELFTKKYDSYGKKKDTQRVTLQNNFRSRPKILDFANFIFEQIMTKKTGDIDYSDNNALVRSPAYDENEPEDTILPQVYIIESTSGRQGRRCEACLVASKIEEMAGKEEIEEGGRKRKIRYGDIAILSAKNEVPEMEQELSARKIPHIRSSNTGFFDSFEVSLLLNILKIIDNPYQDIAFAAVLRSLAAGLNAGDLAVLKAGCEDESFSVYKAALSYAKGEYEQRPIRLKKRKELALFEFMEKLEGLRKEKIFLSVSEITQKACEEFGLYELFGAMSGGRTRKADLDIFYGMAVSYEKNGSAELFGFLRYIERLRENGYERGLAGSETEGADAVEMMTIHKSKGLEFPVVFLINTGGAYAQTESRQDIILDKDLGLGVDLRDTQTKTKTATIAKDLVASKIRDETRAEQMRLLYVALTRAKTRLIVTGNTKNADILRKDAFPDDASACARSVLSCSSHLSLIMLALSNGYKNVCSLDILTEDDVIEQRLKETALSGGLKKRLLELISEDKGRSVKEKLSFSYPFEAAAKMPVKLTASGLERHKEKAAAGEDEKTDRLGITEDGEVSKPYFKGAGALRGTAYHRFFEVLDYSDITAGAEALIEDAVNKGLLKRSEARLIDCRKIDAFLSGPLAGRMKKAFEAGTLKREQPYVMGVENEGETQLIQGIIDAFFEEDGKIVLVDHKTDRYKSPDEFIETYKPQIDAYAAAIERALGKQVKEKLIHSVELEKVIEVK